MALDIISRLFPQASTPMPPDWLMAKGSAPAPNPILTAVAQREAVRNALVPLDEGEMFPQSRRRSIAAAFGDLIEPKTDVILRNFQELQRRNPDKVYELVKEGGETIDTLPGGKSTTPVRYFAKLATPPNTPSGVARSTIPAPDVGRSSFPEPASTGPDFIFRGDSTPAPSRTLPVAFSPSTNPILSAVTSAGRVPTLNPIMDALTNDGLMPTAGPSTEPMVTSADAAPSGGIPERRADERPPNAITGSIRRFVDVPAVLAANAAKWERARPQIAQQPRVIPPRAPMPQIFQALEGVDSGAAQMSGYDPRNPPSAHTISKQQFLTLPPLMQQQYLSATKARAEQIEAAKQRYQGLVNLGQQAALDREITAGRSADPARKMEAEVAAKDLKIATRMLDEANGKMKDAESRFSEWRKGIDTFVARKRIRLDPKTGDISAIDPEDKGTARFVASRIAERAEIEKEIDQATRAQTDAARKAEFASERARTSGVSAFADAPAAPGATSPSSTFASFRPGQRVKQNGITYEFDGTTMKPVAK